MIGTLYNQSGQLNIKVLLVCPYDLDHHGGVQNQVKLLKNGLVSKGINTKILVPSSYDYDIGNAVKIPFNGSQNPITFFPSQKIIKEAILEKNDSFVQEKEELLNEREKLVKANEENEKQAQAVQDQLNEALEKVSALEQAQAERSAIDAFDSRMSEIESEYELNDETRVVVARELKDVEESEEAFAQYQERISVVLKHQNKQFIEEQQKAFDEKLAEAVEKRIQELNSSEASEEEVVEEAIEKVESEEEAVANNNGESSEEELSLRDKFKAAFSEDNLTIKY